MRLINGNKFKNINKLGLSNPIWILLVLFSFVRVQAQDEEEKPEGVVIDKVVAVVGGNIVLQSEIEAQFLQLQMQEGVKIKEREDKCAILKNMVFQKLLLNQAELDSVEVTDAQVESEMDKRFRYYIGLFGSQEKFEQFYNKSVDQFKEELREQIRDFILAQKVQEDLTKDVKITPSEIKNYFKNLPPDSIELVNSQVKLEQIVKLPPVNPEEIERVKNKLEEIRYRVLNGENFATLAILYSEDPGSAKQGGELGLFGRGEMYPEFEAAAFALKKKGDVSDIVKTDAGYHILQLIERRGEYVNVRHILIRPKVSPLDLAKAKVELDSIANLVQEGKYTFEEAVTKFSDDPSKNNSGLLINKMKGTSVWDVDDLDPKVFFVIDKLDVGDISAPVQFQTDDGKDAYRILYLKERTEPHKENLEDDYDKIQEKALTMKKQAEIDDWVKEKVKNTYLKISDEYKSCSFANGWEL